MKRRTKKPGPRLKVMCLDPSALDYGLFLIAPGKRPRLLLQEREPECRRWRRLILECVSALAGVAMEEGR